MKKFFIITIRKVKKINLANWAGFLFRLSQEIHSQATQQVRSPQQEKKDKRDNKFLFFIFFGAVFFSCSAYSGLYRWVDSKGNVFYSDKIPPYAMPLGHIELNQRGLRKKSQLSLVRLKELDDLKKQREKEREERKKKAKADKLKKMQDEQLLAIYSTREELINVFNSKIKMAATTIKILQLRHKVLSNRLAETEIRYEKMKNPAFKETLTKKIDDMLDGLKVYQQAITENIVEKNKLEQRFEIDLERYDRLVGEKNKPPVTEKVNESKIVLK